MDYPKLNLSNQKEESISIQRVKGKKSLSLTLVSEYVGSIE